MARCCLLLEAGLLGSGLTTVLAVFGYETAALVTGGLVLTLMIADDSTRAGGQNLQAPVPARRNHQVTAVPMKRTCSQI